MIKQRFEIDSTFESVEISRKKLEEVIKYLSSEETNIKNVFNMDVRNKKNNELNFNTGLQFINNIFYNWNGSKITGLKDNTYNKSLKKFNNYTIESINYNLFFSLEPVEKENDLIDFYHEQEEQEKILFSKYAFSD